MGNSSSNTVNFDQAEEDIVTYEVSDEALEAAAERGAAMSFIVTQCLTCPFIPFIGPRGSLSTSIKHQ